MDEGKERMVNIEYPALPSLLGEQGMMNYEGNKGALQRLRSREA